MEERSAASPDSTAQVSRWVSVAGRDSVNVFLDTRTIARIDTNNYRVWFRWRFATNQPGLAVTRYNTYGAMLLRTDLDCLFRRLRITQVDYYDTTNRKHLGMRETPSASWDDILPNSFGESFVDSSCVVAQARHLPLRSQ